MQTPKQSPVYLDGTTYRKLAMAISSARDENGGRIMRAVILRDEMYDKIHSEIPKDDLLIDDEYDHLGYENFACNGIPVLRHPPKSSA